MELTEEDIRKSVDFFNAALAGAARSPSPAYTFECPACGGQANGHITDDLTIAAKCDGCKRVILK